MELNELQRLGLEKITAYVPADGSPAKKRSGSAERMKRMRERKKASGIVTVELHADQAAMLEGDLALAARIRQLSGLRKILVMRLLA